MPPRVPPRSPSRTPGTTNMTIDPEQMANPQAQRDTIRLSVSKPSSHPYSNSTGLDDPRSSSTQSLQPVESAGSNRRTLLIVYIHGFMGNETSFKSFPAHVHSLLSITLAESHVVHTKIYPQYQSRRNISFARDGFSNWLSPHEDESTDVILIGHSLGGILGAEVVLIPSHTPGSPDALQHRILGLIAFDTPFLGMHPGVVGTGIASLFRGAPESSAEDHQTSTAPTPSEWSNPMDTSQTDPYYNPAYPNDVHLPVHRNKWEKAWYFWNKHCGDLTKAAQSYVKSHLEFGGCLADYPGLRKRYTAVRSLEDIDDLSGSTNQHGRLLHRVRFVNYYTASSGRIKEQKSSSSSKVMTMETEMRSLDINPAPPQDSASSTSHTLQPLSGEENEDTTLEIEDETLDHEESSSEDLEQLESRPMEEVTETQTVDTVSLNSSLTNDLPPLPPEPEQPSTIDTSSISDPDALRLAQKENTRKVKAYEQAKKDREKAIRERDKVVTKRKRELQRDRDRAELDEQQNERLGSEQQKSKDTLNPEDHVRQLATENQQSKHHSKSKQSDRKFCTLPTKDTNGQRDPTWIRVYMEGMDEVIAHTSLFEVSDTYAKLVGDTAGRIENWVREDATMRTIRLEQGDW